LTAKTRVQVLHGLARADGCRQDPPPLEWKTGAALSRDSLTRPTSPLILRLGCCRQDPLPLGWKSWFSYSLPTPRPTSTIPQLFNKIKTKFCFTLQWYLQNRGDAMLGCSFMHALQQWILAYINLSSQQTVYTHEWFAASFHPQLFWH
jgi:hypothetical protein